MEVSLIHDGADRGVGEAEQYAKLLAGAPVMLTLLRAALTAWSERFDAPDDTLDARVSGGDLVEWFYASRTSTPSRRNGASCASVARASVTSVQGGTSGIQECDAACPSLSAVART